MQTIAIPIVSDDQAFEEASRRLETLVTAAPGTPERYEADPFLSVPRLDPVVPNESVAK